MPFNLVVLYCYLTLLKNRDFIKGDIGRKLILQTIDVNELAVEFFLVLVELLELMLPLLLVLLYAPCQAVELWSSRVDAEAFTSFLVVILYKNVDVVHVGLLVY